MKRAMNIAFFGSSLVSSYWNGAATYYRGLLKALALRGHRITFYEPDAYERQQHRDIPDPEWAKVIVYPGDQAHAACACVERAAETADVLVKASGVGVHDELLEAALPTLRRAHQIIIYWDVDAPATLERLDADPGEPLRKRIPQYDAVFTYGGGDPVVRGFRGYGARACVPIYNALDPETHYRVPAVEAFRADLSLLANRLPDREQRVEDFFVGPAAKNPGRVFILGGNGWQDKPLPHNVKRLGHVSTRDHNALNSSALAVLNVARDSMAKVGFSPATRVFEAAGAAACLISDSWPGLELFLEPDHEILVAENGDEVSEKVAALDVERARAIGRAAYRRVLAAHTYARRAEQVESTLMGRQPSRLEVCA
jgi:spore maturation protein CgeB